MKSGRLIALIALIALMFGACALLIASLMFLVMEIAERTVEATAERTSVTWANYISTRLSDIEGTVSGGHLTKTDREFLEGVREFGEVFRFKMFDGTGRLVLKGTSKNPYRLP